MVQEHLFIKNSVAGDMTVFEVESIFSCDYPNDIHALYKHYGTGTASPAVIILTWIQKA